MYKLCKTEQSAARQRQLELGLLQAMKNCDFEDISISDLCDGLAIPRKSFYRYFSSKDGALIALIDHTLMEFDTVSFNRLSDRNASAAADLQRYFKFWFEQKALLDALQRSRLSGLLVERAMFHAFNESLMPRYLRALPENIQAIALNFSVCGLMSMVLQWHHQGFRETTETMAQVALMMLSKPLLPGN